MPRPFCQRRIAFVPSVTYFKPAGVPLRELEEVALALDELEALRLADLEGLYQEQGAREMGVSRATFARIVESARRKVADALTSGKALRLEGGPVVHPEGGVADMGQGWRHGRHGHGWGAGPGDRRP
jgi:predicted DNA-binding protein (UPF0251 family)